MLSILELTIGLKMINLLNSKDEADEETKINNMEISRSK